MDRCVPKGMLAQMITDHAQLLQKEITYRACTTKYLQGGLLYCAALYVCGIQHLCIREQLHERSLWTIEVRKGSTFLLFGPRVWMVTKDQTVPSLCRWHLARRDRGYLSLALGYRWWDIIIPKGVLSTADCGDHAITELQRKKKRKSNSSILYSQGSSSLTDSLGQKRGTLYASLASLGS